MASDHGTSQTSSLLSVCLPRQTLKLYEVMDHISLALQYIFSFSYSAWYMHVYVLFSPVQLLSTPGTVACQAPLTMGFSRQEYWTGLPCPPPGDLPDPGIKLVLLLPFDLAGRFFTTALPPGKPIYA